MQIWNNGKDRVHNQGTFLEQEQKKKKIYCHFQQIQRLGGVTAGSYVWLDFIMRRTQAPGPHYEQSAGPLYCTAPPSLTPGMTRQQQQQPFDLTPPTTEHYPTIAGIHHQLLLTYREQLPLERRIACCQSGTRVQLRWRARSPDPPVYHFPHILTYF
jgi:hypothetical protein